MSAERKFETVQTRPIIRTIEIERAAADETARTIPVCFASEQPVWEEQLGAMLILDHSTGSPDFSRMEGGPVFIQHNDQGDTIAVAEHCTLRADKKSAAVLRFSKSARGAEFYQDAKDGIRRQVSVRADLGKLILESVTDGVKTLRAMKWSPKEISFVGLAADRNTGVLRDDKTQTINTEIEVTRSETINPPLHHSTTMTTEEKAAADLAARTSLETARGETLTGERKRITDISASVEALLKTYPEARETFRALETKAIREGQTHADFNMALLASLPGVRAVTRQETPEIGMNRKEVKRFSLIRAARQMAMVGCLDGLEKEACETARAHFKRDLKAGEFIIPEEVADYGRQRINTQRAQSSGVFSAGGALVQEEYGPMIEFLRNRTILGQAGITIISGLMGDFILPVQTGGATAYWVSETGALTDTAATFGQKAMLPHRLGATIPFTTQFLAQSSISAEDLLRNELMIAMALKKDAAGLQGTGVGAEPLGIQGTTGINATVTHSGAADWGDVVQFETGINADNADIGSMAFILSSAAVGKWKTIPKVATYGNVFLIENNVANGYPVLRTNQITGDYGFFGVWSQLLGASWAGLSVIVDPYALKKSGQIEITMNELCDFLVRQPLAFNVATDSSAQ